MLQNYLEPYACKDFKYKAEHIDKLVQWALQKESQRINDKYSSISNTVKMLKNLMIQFSKKADNLQKHMLSITRIQETQFQSIYYQKRINQCLQLSEKLRKQIECKNKKINERQKQANILKRSLIKLKTENIKIMMKMEDIQYNSIVEEDKQNMDAIKEKRKIKQSQDRKLITNSNIKFSKNTLKQESIRLQLQLLRKIDKVSQLRSFIQSCFSAFRQKLKKQQKKSNLYGLAGSMYFKLQSKDQSVLPRIKKLNDSKLMIYDVLKQKYRRHVKSQNKKEQQLIIGIQQFMKFTPIQIMGIIQLKGGLSNIISKNYISDINPKINQNQIKTKGSETNEELQVVK